MREYSFINYWDMFIFNIEKMFLSIKQTMCDSNIESMFFIKIKGILLTNTEI